MVWKKHNGLFEQPNKISYIPRHHLFLLTRLFFTAELKIQNNGTVKKIYLKSKTFTIRFLPRIILELELLGPKFTLQPM